MLTTINIPNGGRMSKNRRQVIFGTRGITLVTEIDVDYPAPNASAVRALIRKLAAEGIRVQDGVTIVEALERSERVGTYGIDSGRMLSTTRTSLSDLMQFAKTKGVNAKRKSLGLYADIRDRVPYGVRAVMSIDGRDERRFFYVKEYAQALVSICRRNNFRITGAKTVDQLPFASALTRPARSSSKASHAKGTIAVSIPLRGIVKPKAWLYSSNVHGAPTVTLHFQILGEYPLPQDSKQLREAIQYARQNGFKISGADLRVLEQKAQHILKTGAIMRKVIMHDKSSATKQQHPYSPSFVTKLQYVVNTLADIAATMHDLGTDGTSRLAHQVAGALHSAARRNDIPLRLSSGYPDRGTTPQGTLNNAIANARGVLLAIQPLRGAAQGDLLAEITRAGLNIARLLSEIRATQDDYMSVGKGVGFTKPYAVVHRGDKWTVHRRDTEGNPAGPSLGEHGSEAEARRQIAAIWANEGKSSARWPTSARAARTKKQGMDMSKKTSNRKLFDYQTTLVRLWAFINKSKQAKVPGTFVFMRDGNNVSLNWRHGGMTEHVGTLASRAAFQEALRGLRTHGRRIDNRVGNATFLGLVQRKSSARKALDVSKVPSGTLKVMAQSIPKEIRALDVAGHKIRQAAARVGSVRDTRAQRVASKLSGVARLIVSHYNERKQDVIVVAAELRKRGKRAGQLAPIATERSANTKLRIGRYEIGLRDTNEINKLNRQLTDVQARLELTRRQVAIDKAVVQALDAVVSDIQGAIADLIEAERYVPGTQYAKVLHAIGDANRAVSTVFKQVYTDMEGNVTGIRALETEERRVADLLRKAEGKGAG